MDKSPVVVTDQTGQRALIISSPVKNGEEPQVLVRLENNEQLLIPANLLVEQADGGRLLPYSFAELLAQAAGEVQRIPVIEEHLHVEKQVAESGGVRINKLVHERQEAVEVPLFAEEVEIRRTVVNRPVDGPVEPRYEGDTLVIPLLEEVVVVQKQLLLREEIYITKKQIEMHQTEQVTLRGEEVVVEPVEAQGRIG
jgi:uncharacterized protein (TIGR02271 family)